MVSSYLKECQRVQGVLLHYRPLISLMAAGLLLGVSVQTKTMGFATLILALMVCWICGLTMLWNDLSDRKEDTAKSCHLISPAASRLRLWAAGQWMVLCASVLAYAAWQFGEQLEIGVIAIRSGILLGQIVVGIWGYTWLRPRYLINNFCVALTAASPALLVLPLSSDQNFFVVGTFLTVALMIFAREILKDIEDREADMHGTKKTVATKEGPRKALIISCTTLSTSPLMMLVGIILMRSDHYWLLTPVIILAAWNVLCIAQLRATLSPTNSLQLQRALVNKVVLDLCLVTLIAIWLVPPH